MKDVEVIILSGGVGSRTKLNTPKQYIELKDNLDSIDLLIKEISALGLKISVVAQVEWKDYILKKNVSFIEGGETRNQTIFNGLSKTNNDVVMIDAARPFIKKEQIDKLIKYGKDAVFASFFPSAIYSSFESKLMSVEDKNKFMVAETPHYYTKDSVKFILENFDYDAIDIPEILINHKKEVKVFESSFWKVKITTKEDIDNAKKLL